MSLHINRLLERIKAADSRAQREITMTTAEARDLHADITRLLLKLEAHNTAVSTEEITVEIKGEPF